MKCKHYKNKVSTRALIFRLCMIIYIAAVAYLCFGKFDSLIQNNFNFFIPIDKIVHFCMFFPFPIISFFSFDRHFSKFSEALLFFIITASIGCIFAGITEIVQGSLPYRTADINDFGADCLAICLSSIIALITNCIYARKKN